MRRADLDLAARIGPGETGAFEELYTPARGRLYNLVCRMAGAPQDAEDLLQDVFLLAYRKIGSYRGEASLGTWLYRLAMNHCLDVLRNRHARMGQADRVDGRAGCGSRSQPGADVGAVNRLDLERAIVRCRPRAGRRSCSTTWKGSGTRRSATILGVSEGTSKSQVHKARMRIRAYLSGRVAPGAVGAGHGRE